MGKVIIGLALIGVGWWIYQGSKKKVPSVTIQNLSDPADVVYQGKSS